jgi:hypothetical protein
VPLRVSRISFVPVDVKRFLKQFGAGRQAPYRYLDEISTEYKPLVDKWLATPPDRRVFVVGSGTDAALVRGLRSSYEKLGYAVFFYEFCAGYVRELCSPEVVGAFFGTAGKVLFADTPAAAASRFVPYEIATVQGHQLIILAVPSEVLVARDVLAAGVPVARDVLAAGAPTVTANLVEYEQKDNQWWRKARAEQILRKALAEQILIVSKTPW